MNARSGREQFLEVETLNYDIGLTAFVHDPELLLSDSGQAGIAAARGPRRGGCGIRRARFVRCRSRPGSCGSPGRSGSGDLRTPGCVLRSLSLAAGVRFSGGDQVCQSSRERTIRNWLEFAIDCPGPVPPSLHWWVPRRPHVHTAATKTSPVFGSTTMPGSLDRVRILLI